ncbi:hypothetical protein VP01_2598g6 [Puccinia sorghi]|uniref:Tet-like 2OG-Fe(II) oxygenase domain-containing protein n=1 Tax=Puccinia sorghi TaxID=27349 RepID=A0A0L6V6I0_9BASI|nr:hypothetical protein VP01_2598g6 [Puccinia sorghi]
MSLVFHKKQKNITLSSTESEMNVLFDGEQENQWLKFLIKQLWKLKLDSKNFCVDNRGLMEKLKNFWSNSKTKHLNIKIKNLRKKFKNKEIDVQLIPSELMIADSLSKAALFSSMKKLQDKCLTVILSSNQEGSINSSASALSSIDHRIKPSAKIPAIQDHATIAMYSQTCRLLSSLKKFFDQNQFLLADSAYTSDWFTLPDYKGKELLDHQNVNFNYHLAQKNEGFHQVAHENLMQEYGIPNWSQDEWVEMKKDDGIEYSFESNVSVTYNGFHKKSHQDKKDINGWTYGIFSYIDKRTGKPIPSPSSYLGNGFLFPQHDYLIDFAKSNGIEILWQTTEFEHQTIQGPPSLQCYDLVTPLQDLNVMIL